MAKKNPENEKKDEKEIAYAKEIADKVLYLFKSCRDQNGDRYTYSDVERLTGGKITQGWISKLVNGQATRPGLAPLQTLTDFFEVEPTYWFRPLSEAPYYINQKKNLDDVNKIAHRAIVLSPESRQIILEIIESFEKRGM